MTLFSYSVLVIFFSKPAMTRSEAISKSMLSMNSLFPLAARIAASLQRFIISAPLNPGVKVAKRLEISSIVFEGSILRGVRWTLNISFLPSKSGFVISIYLSNLPGRTSAGSSSSFLFVAANTITLESVENPSISTSNWFKVFALSSPPPPLSVNYIRENCFEQNYNINPIKNLNFTISFPSNSINFVDKNDRRRFLLSFSMKKSH